MMDIPASPGAPCGGEKEGGGGGGRGVGKSRREQLAGGEGGEGEAQGEPRARGQRNRAGQRTWRKMRDPDERRRKGDKWNIREGLRKAVGEQEERREKGCE